MFFVDLLNSYTIKWAKEACYSAICRAQYLKNGGDMVKIRQSENLLNCRPCRKDTRSVSCWRLIFKHLCPSMKEGKRCGTYGHRDIKFYPGESMPIRRKNEANKEDELRGPACYTRRTLFFSPLPLSERGVSILCISRGKRVVSRTFSAPSKRAVNRSSPIASPPSGGMPYLNASR